jgi:hypothetical protein
MCWEPYDRDLDYCPKKSCDGDVVEIDDDLVPIIVGLNEKGYITEYCCSGHAYVGSGDAYPRTYIKFAAPIRKELFPNLPSGFKIENAQDGTAVLDAEYSTSKGLRTHAKVAKGIARLALWVNKLPPLDESVLIDELEKVDKGS